MKQVGFELELSGSDKNIQFNPACPECLQIQSVLQAIASLIPDEKDGNVTLEVDHREQCISYSAARGNRPDVTLAIRVLHPTGFSDPVDSYEIQCLERMKTRLRQLGACERQWIPNSYHPTEALAAA